MHMQVRLRHSCSGEPLHLRPSTATGNLGRQTSFQTSPLSVCIDFRSVRSVSHDQRPNEPLNLIAQAQVRVAPNVHGVIRNALLAASLTAYGTARRTSRPVRLPQLMKQQQEPRMFHQQSWPTSFSEGPALLTSSFSPVFDAVLILINAILVALFLHSPSPFLSLTHHLSPFSNQIAHVSRCRIAHIRFKRSTT